MENLTIEMMLSHYEGDLLTEIARAIKSNPSVASQFRSLGTGALLADNLQNEMLEYVLRKFARMRGNWFMKALKGQATVQHKAVAQMSTRKNVAAVSAAASAASAARKQAELNKGNVDSNHHATTGDEPEETDRDLMYKTLMDTVLNGGDVVNGMDEEEDTA